MVSIQAFYETDDAITGVLKSQKYIDMKDVRAALLEQFTTRIGPYLDNFEIIGESADKETKTHTVNFKIEKKIKEVEE